ncbi:MULTISPECIES: glycosyltransferase family 4 protein [Priestia]|uniref:glycosyltransferase family 4 protein n=1 Tax=Priestia TaxID=2800373 RepID=UPI002E1AC9A9|nr:glycosyltransferase family 4 protein [Priestia aryabhattai]
MNKKILLAGFKFPHHSDSSGYHHLATYINGHYLNADELIFGQAPIDSKIRQVNFMYFEFILKLRGNQQDVIHYIYPEQHLLFSTPKNDKTISIATIHLDEQWLDKEVKVTKKFLDRRRRTYESLDGIISLSNDQVERLKKIYPNKHIRFIPHGINKLKSYAEYKRSESLFSITVVGSNYRDKELLFKVMEMAQKDYPTWKFNLVGISKEWKKEASGFSNAIVHPFLTESQYFEVMQSSDVHLLPVEFATANNALLEAHALGVPSLTSSCAGIVDYSLESTFHFNNEQEAIEQLAHVASMNDEEYLNLRRCTQIEAEKFHWSEIARQVEEFYEQVKISK